VQKENHLRILGFALFLCIAIIWGNSGGNVPSASAQQPPSNQMVIGKMNLFGDYWDVLNLQGVNPAHRTELRLFPKSGPTTDQPDLIGGEITISGDDLNNLNSTGDYHLMSIYTYGQEYRIQSQSGGNAAPYPIRFDSMGGFINFSLNTDGSLGISRGISNTEGAGGFAHQRIPACNARVGPSCAVQLNWQTPFGDTNYTATCTLGGSAGFVNWTEKANSFLTVTVNHIAGSVGGEVDCIAVHD
jgi:hypothetical protein